MRRQFSFILSFVLLAIFIPLHGVSATLTSICDASDWTDGEIKLENYFDALEIAEATSRASLAPILLEVRKDQRIFERTEFPDCVKSAAAGMSDAMREYVTAYELFLGDDNSYLQSAGKAQRDMNAAGKTLSDLGLSVDFRATLTP